MQRPALIVLDTNVLSELLRPRPQAEVVKWFGSQPPALLRVTAIAQAEMLYGARLLPQPRRAALIDTIRSLFAEFEGRLLAFDSHAAEAYAGIAAHRRQSGRPMSPFDAQIAAIAIVADAAVATRNVADFSDCGVALINPWTA